MNKTITYEKVLREVDYIIKNMPHEIQNKIPDNFKQAIVSNMDKNYIPEPYDKNKTLDEQNISEETKKILALIYRNYIVSDEERKKLIIEENKIAQELEKEKKNKYNIEDIFNNKNISSQNINIDSNKDKLITMQSNNKKWYIKVLEKLIKFFSKK